MSVVLINPGRDPVENWVKALNKALPDIEIRIWPDAGNREEVRFIIANTLPPGAFATFPNLAFVAGTAVGVERLLNDPALSPHVPILRQRNEERAGMMSAWVVYHVLRHQRRFDDYEANKAKKLWQPLEVVPPANVRIGVMGLGNLGLPVARALSGLMYRVSGWSRSEKRIEEIETFAGMESFPAFLAQSDIVVSILPKTPETAGLLNAKTLAHLPDGAYVINAGRGTLIDEDALLQAIDSGRLSGAALDVFQTEPLPEDHPFWTHPKIAITPHYACQGRAEYSARTAIANIKRVLAGQEPVGLVDRKAGY